MRRLALVAVVALVAASCASTRIDTTGIEAPRVVTLEEVEELLATAELPVVLNVWASWCIPCRSEAPLLRAAASTYRGRVRFVLLDVRDTPDDAKAFIAEFLRDAPIEHLADPPGTIPVVLGAGRGVPDTLFYRVGGEESYIHRGMIDERTLALQIAELLEGG